MKVFAILLVIGLVSAYTEVDYQESFARWMHEHGKTYSAEEFHRRYEAFKANMDFIRDFNADGTHTHTVGLNFLADLTNEEYRQIYLGLRFDASSMTRSGAPHEISGRPLADKVDWRTKGAVTPVKDQGQCGSCWSFSTTGSVEGAHQIATGNLVSLSEQNLMDCSSAYGNAGCGGGLMDSAFRYIIANHGIDTEASYPYLTRQGTCAFNTNNIGATISAYKDLPSGDENALQDAVNSIGPISVGIDAGHPSFQLYKSGVYYEPKCSATRLDHGVLAVGYGTDGSNDYWIVKNSWGAAWGDEGYLLMSRNKTNNCGIATLASYPVV